MGVDDGDLEVLPGLGVLLINLLPGLDGVLMGGRALGVDGGIDEVGIAVIVGLLKALLKDIGVELSMGGDLRGAEQHPVKLLRSKIIAVFILLVPHGDGEGEHLNIQLLPQSAGDVGGRIGNHFYVSHSGLLNQNLMCPHDSLA